MSKFNMFKNLGFSIKNINTTTIADQLQPVTLMSAEDAAKGRPIKKYPTKYDYFDSYNDTVNYILIQLKEHNLQKEWLSASECYEVPIIQDKDVYYTYDKKISISAYEPREPFQDLVRGITILNLSLTQTNFKEIENLINDIKNGTSEQR